jgi:hypothetical protein
MHGSWRKISVRYKLPQYTDNVAVSEARGMMLRDDEEGCSESQPRGPGQGKDVID